MSDQSKENKPEAEAKKVEKFDPETAPYAQYEFLEDHAGYSKGMVKLLLKEAGETYIGLGVVKVYQPGK